VRRRSLRSRRFGFEASADGASRNDLTGQRQSGDFALLVTALQTLRAFMRPEEFDDRRSNLSNVAVVLFFRNRSADALVRSRLGSVASAG